MQANAPASLSVLKSFGISTQPHIISHTLYLQQQCRQGIKYALGSQLNEYLFKLSLFYNQDSRLALQVLLATNIQLQ